MQKFDEEMNLDKKNTPIEEITGKVKFDPQAHIVKKKDSDKKIDSKVKTFFKQEKYLM